MAVCVLFGTCFISCTTTSAAAKDKNMQKNEKEMKDDTMMENKDMTSDTEMKDDTMMENKDMPSDTEMKDDKTMQNKKA